MKKNHVFLLKLFLSFIVAYLTSRIGAGLSDFGWVQDVLIMTMYLGLGLGNDFSVILKGFSNLRLYILTQSSIFIIAPIVSMVFFQLAMLITTDQSFIGLLFVGCLPTTITSCIMLTQHSNGNTVGSVYNAMLAQLISVVVSPLILSLMISMEVSSVTPPLTVVYKLAQRILIPLFLGQLFRALLPALFNRIGGRCEKISFNAIFIILYMNLSSLLRNSISGSSLFSIAISTLFAVLMFMVMVHLNWILSGLARLPLPDRISSAYTGTQKTLAMGVPLATILFPHDVALVSQITIVIIGYYVSSLLFSVIIIEGLIASFRARCGSDMQKP